MTDRKKAAGQTAASGNARPYDTKEASILAVLRSGQSLNRFEAERLGDHCLHSTVSTLRDKGYLFHDEWERVPTRFGKEANVKRYWYIGLANGAN